jgi:tetratricopeptide (TPR) repeat protein
MAMPARLGASALVIAAALTLSVAPPALAQRRGRGQAPAKVDPKIAEAKKLFEEGASAYGLGNYEQAIKAFEKSYELSKKPLIFESMANAYERLGNAKKAREYLAKWRDAAPEEERGLLDARIKNLDARIAREEEAAAKEAQEKAAREAREKAEAEAKKSKWFLPGAITTGGGAALLITGIVIDAVAGGKRPADGLCKAAANGNTYCQPTAGDAVKSSNTLAVAGDVLWITGAVAAAAGVTLLFVLKPKPLDEAPPKAAWIAPSLGGVVVGGQF